MDFSESQKARKLTYAYKRFSMLYFTFYVQIAHVSLFTHAHMRIEPISYRSDTAAVAATATPPAVDREKSLQ